MIDNETKGTNLNLNIDLQFDGDPHFAQLNGQMVEKPLVFRLDDSDESLRRISLLRAYFKRRTITSYAAGGERPNAASAHRGQD